MGWVDRTRCLLLGSQEVGEGLGWRGPLLSHFLSHRWLLATHVSFFTQHLPSDTKPLPHSGNLSRTQGVYEPCGDSQEEMGTSTWPLPRLIVLSRGFRHQLWVKRILVRAPETVISQRHKLPPLQKKERACVVVGGRIDRTF